MGKLLVITGGSKGIGKATVIRFAKAGFDIATCARKLSDLDQLKTEIEASYSVKVYTFQADVSDKGQAQAFGKFVAEMGLVAEVLVNNAGFFLPGSILSEANDTFESMMDTNLASAYHVTRGVVPAMVKNKGGYVFNICSIASITAYENGGSYCISKFGMLGMTKVLRQETKKSGVRVSAVMPGAVLTDSWAGTDLPKERFIQPEDIAEAIWSAYNLSSGTVVEEIVIRPQLGDL